MTPRTHEAGDTMSYTNQAAHAARYKEAAILGSSPERLVLLLYEHLLVSLRRAALQIQSRNIEGKAQSLEKASDIVFELLASLDFEAGGELASRLAALYGWFITEIGEVSRTLDRERLERLISIVGTLHEAWIGAAEQLKNGGGGATGDILPQPPAQARLP